MWTVKTSLTASPPLQFHHDIPARIELASRAGRHQAGGVVFLNDERARPRRAEVGAAQHRRVEEAVVGAEVGAARPLRRGLAAGEHHALGHRAALAHAGADRLDREQFDRLLGAGAVAVGALVLGAERFFSAARKRASTGPSGAGTTSS